MEELYSVWTGTMEWLANHPEISVTAAIFHLFFMLIQVVMMCRSGKNQEPDDDDYEEFPQIPNKVTVVKHVPYVPEDNVLKLLKLLKTKETGWQVVNGYWNVLTQKTEEYLGCGGLKLFFNGLDVSIACNDVFVNLKSSNQLYDQILLKEAWINRMNKEKEKIRIANNQRVEQASQNASKMLDEYLK